MNTIKRKFRSNEIIVNTRSNFKSHLVKCQEIVDNNEFETLVIKGMGKATFRAINLALELNSNNHNTFEIKPKTYSVDVLEDRDKKPIRGADRDGYDPDGFDKTRKKLTHVPAIEITVSKSRIEFEKLREAKRKLKQKDKSR